MLFGGIWSRFPCVVHFLRVTWTGRVYELKMWKRYGPPLVSEGLVLAIQGENMVT
jgi:hypothetical protein